MARNQISRTKIGFFFVFIFGVSFYLFASLEESNVMAFLIPLDVSEEKVLEEIVKEDYSNPEWFKFYYESDKMKDTISVNKCCNKKEKFLVTYDMGYGDEEKWLVCEEHDKDEPFQENILEKKLVWKEKYHN